MTKLNAGGDTLSGVHYTVIESQNDEVVTPYQSAFLTGPSSQVTNIDLQTQCSLDQGEHLSMPYDHIADADVLSRARSGLPVSRCLHAGGAGGRRLTALQTAAGRPSSCQARLGLARQSPERPPDFSSSATEAISAPRSIPLTMS